MERAPRAAGGQGGDTVRQLARLLVVAAAWSCASAGTPPGGPEDFDSPKIVRVRPDTNAVNVRASGVTFDFDEVVSERPRGATDLGSLFLVSPSAGTPNISWRRKTVSVSPRGGLRPGTTYTVRMLPGLTDLESNVDSVGTVVVFSTGPTIATGHLRGVVFDWPAEKPGVEAFIEAFPIPTSRDSIRYVALADSSGTYDLAHVPPGRYLLRGMIDANRNRLLDPRELYDTVTVTLADSLRHEILAFVHDTLGAGIQTVTVADSLTLRVALDRALDTSFVLDTTRFTLKQADSTAVRIARVLSRRAYEQERDDSIRTKAIQDSIQKVARADSARAADTTKVAAPPPAPPASRRTPPRRAAPPPAAESPDTAARRKPAPKPSVPAPVSEVMIKLGTPLRPGTTYRLRAIELRTLLRYARTSERVFTTEKERKAADTTRKGASRPDSAARPRPDTGRIGRGVVPTPAPATSGTPPLHARALVRHTTPWTDDRRPPSFAVR